MDIRIVTLEPRHADIIPRLRQADVEEIRAMTGTPPELPVTYSIMTSYPGWAAEVNGRTEAVFGAGPGRELPDGGTVGVPWLVGSNEIAKHPVEFFRISMRIIGEMRKHYDLLENWVDARNVLSIRWLDWAGFTIEPPETAGAEGRLFHRFWMKGSVENVYAAGGGGRGHGNSNAGNGGEQRG